MTTGTMPRAATSKGKSLLRLLAVVTGALVLCWIALAVTLSLGNARRNPALALRLWPGNSLAEATMADQLAADAVNGAPNAAARTHAIASLASQPGNPVAARVMGMMTGFAGDRQAMMRWLAYSERYSRRDLAVQLVQIETAVEQGRIDAALVHYDRALRVFAPQPGLVDVLVTATATPEVRRSLLPILRRNPPWRQGYLIQLVESGRVPVETVYVALHDLHLNPRDAFDRRILGEAASLLVKQGKVALARALVEIRGNSVRNGDFEAPNPYPPLDWQLTDTGDLSAVAEQGVRPRGGNALFLEARNDAAGVVAQQILSLAPGRYAVTLISGDGASSATEAPTITIGCIGRGDPLASAALPTGRDVVRSFRTPSFLVPQGCIAQRLAITVSAESGLDAVRPWIDDVKIVPLS